MNFKKSQFKILIFQKVSIKGYPLGFFVKSYQNFQNTFVFIFFFKKNKDLSMSIFVNSVKF
jgi:hypothetical protein